jgi:hypothetical protein
MDKVDPVMNRDLTAAYLSIFPGAGHLYKHQFRTGMLIMLPGNMIAGLVAGLMAFATLGAAIIVIPALWVAWAAWDAYDAPDLSHRAKPGA